MANPLSIAFEDWLTTAPRHAGRSNTFGPLDAIVVGSGYGGSVAALRLAEQGYRVVVLERGAEFLAGDFANDLGQLTKFLRGNGPSGPTGSMGGLFDVHAGPGLAALVASGLGGGSLINAGVMMKPDDDVFAQAAWPAEIRGALDARLSANGVGLGLDAAFERAAAELGGEVYRDISSTATVSTLPKAMALKRVGDALKSVREEIEEPQFRDRIDFAAKPATVTISMDACKRCGDCFTGCNVPGAKKTLASSYLKRARARGAVLVTGCTVHALDTGAGSTWELHVLASEKVVQAQSLADAVAIHGVLLHAGLVVVSAGTFGSTELLMRSTSLAKSRLRLSPTLGARLSGNGDSLSVLADLPEAAGGVGHGADCGKPPVGPTITTLLDLRGHPVMTERLVIQEGAVPGALRRIYEELLATSWTFRHIGERWRTPRTLPRGADPLSSGPAVARNTLMLLTMGHDESAGRIVWVPSMNGAAPYWPDPRSSPTHIRQQAVFEAAAQATDSVHLDAPTWRMLAPEVAEFYAQSDADATLLTVHPLGGCAMSDSFEQGVVDHRGRAWRGPLDVWPNLYVLDGSIIPTSLGCNPLWTITALAERAMAYHAQSMSAPHHPAAVAGDRSPPWPLPPRDPVALARSREPRYDLDIGERLEKRALVLRGALRDAFGLDSVDSDFVIRMRARDWTAVWDGDSAHKLSQLAGRLRLVQPLGGTAGGTRRSLDYEIVSGHVDLFGHDQPWPILSAVARALRTLRVGVTWWILRGRRDNVVQPEFMTLSRIGLALKLAWQIAEERRVRYDVTLARAPDATVEGAPRELRLRGVKLVRYAATWWEIVVHTIERIRQGRTGAQEGGRQLGDLRASLVHQLTRPVIRLDDRNGWLQYLPAWLAGATRARFDFDPREALLKSPPRLWKGGDSSSAVLALLAYPALLARYLALTRLLEFRLPDYSGRPPLDNATPDDVGLRVKGNGVCRPEEILLPVRHGRSSSDDGSEDPKTVLRLWRYRRPGPANALPERSDGTWCGMPVVRAKTVLLTHAFAMSGDIFTFKTTDQNFAEHLYENGWEVWVLDSRMSCRTRAGTAQSTVDQLGLIDAPAAVDRIINIVSTEFGLGTPDRLQISAFGHCMGAASLLIGLLGGKLSYDDCVAGPVGDPNTQQRSVMPKLAALVTSQTHPFIVGSRGAQLRTWIPPFLRDVAGRTQVVLGFRGEIPSTVVQWADRLFAASPVPKGERCPDEGYFLRPDDDDCVTCRRLRFLLSGMYSHRHLNIETHLALPRLFGSGSIRLFAHGAKFFEYERLCSEDGLNVYATDHAIRRRLALPIRFVHGETNQFFDRESALRSSAQYRRLHSGWADRYGCADACGTKEVHDLIEDYGHLDVLFGKDAMRPANDGKPSPYERMSQLLDEAWKQPHAGPTAQTPKGDALVTQFPKAGPFLGPVTEVDGVRGIGVSFIIDDGTAANPSRSHACAGALVWQGDDERSGNFVPFEILGLAIPVPARDGFRPDKSESCDALRVARASLALDAYTAAGAVHIRCFSYSRTMPGPVLTVEALGQARVDGVSTSPRGWPDLSEGLRTLPLQSQATSARPRTQLSLLPPAAYQPTVPMLLVALEATRDAAISRLRDVNEPFPRSPSRLTPASCDERSVATLPARLFAGRTPESAVQLAIGCCRYEGFAIDRDRADEALIRLSETVASGEASPDLLMMLGDQIYADRWAGLGDPLSPIERFMYRHQESFTTKGFATLTSTLPTLCIPDDHEFNDSYPLGKPLFLPRARFQREAALRQALAASVATQTVSAYQLQTLPPQFITEGWCSFDIGNVRVFVFDTRLHRQFDADRFRVLDPMALTQFEKWLEDGRDSSALHCVASGSVFLPGLVPGNDPADPGPFDTMQAAEDQRREVLGRLVAAVPRRFVMISGDYHLSFAGAVHCNDEVVGAAVIAPPFYAPLPYANCAPDDLWFAESISVAGNVLKVPLDSRFPARRGSGFGLLNFRQRGMAWQVELIADLMNLDTGQGWATHRWMIELGTV